MHVSKRKRKKMDDISVDPEVRIAPEFDSTGIRKSETASRKDMGFRVVDNCPEEHQQ